MIMANKAPKSQLGATHLVGLLPSHIQRALVENSELPSQRTLYGPRVSVLITKSPQ